MNETSPLERLDAEFAREVEENRLRLRGALRATYDFIVCGSGSSGAVVVRRLAENPDVSVLLIQMGCAADCGRRGVQWALVHEYTVGRILG